jgi:hypothetical protein
VATSILHAGIPNDRIVETLVLYAPGQFNRRPTMKIAVILLTATVALSTAQLTLAGQDEYCWGFNEGYKSVAGDAAATPACPAAPATPAGSTDFREGLKDGMNAAGG